jgi:hypothetical protein
VAAFLPAVLLDCLAPPGSVAASPYAIIRALALFSVLTAISQIGRLVRRCRASESSCGQAMTAGL